MENTEIIMNNEWYANYIAVQKSLTDDREWDKLYRASLDKVHNYVAKKFRARYMCGFTVEDVVQRRITSVRIRI